MGASRQNGNGATESQPNLKERGAVEAACPRTLSSTRRDVLTPNAHGSAWHTHVGRRTRWRRVDARGAACGVRGVVTTHLGVVVSPAPGGVLLAVLLRHIVLDEVGSGRW